MMSCILRNSLIHHRQEESRTYFAFTILSFHKVFANTIRRMLISLPSCKQWHATITRQNHSRNHLQVRTAKEAPTSFSKTSTFLPRSITLSGRPHQQLPSCFNSTSKKAHFPRSKLLPNKNFSTLSSEMFTVVL